jgi:hypothetical protein
VEAIIKLMVGVWLFMAYTYMATYYTALMKSDARPEAQQNFVHIVVLMWFAISIYWLIKI